MKLMIRAHQPQVDLAARVTQLEAQLRSQFEMGIRRSSFAVSSDAGDFGVSQLPQKRKLPVDSQTVPQHTPVPASNRLDTETKAGGDQNPYE
jgi:hypothetical protein